jgi:hypothetical protein
MFESSPIHSSIPYCTLTADLFNFDDLLYKWGRIVYVPIHCGLFKASISGFRFPEQLKARKIGLCGLLFKNNCSTFIDKPLALV